MRDGRTNDTPTLATGASKSTPLTQAAVFETWRWVEDTAPSSSIAESFYDEERQELIALTTSLGETTTWAWNGTRWRRAASSAQTPPSPSVAYDRARRVGLAVQGSGAGTWTWDGTAWERREVPSHPAFGYSVALAYIAALERVAAYDASGVTRVWDGTAWTTSMGVGPPARSGGVLIEHETGALLLGGCLSDPFAYTDETWALDARGWTQGPALVGPPLVSCTQQAVRTNDGRIVLGIADGSERYLWFRSTAGTWTRDPLEMQSTLSGTLAWDKKNDRAMIAGAGSTALMRVRDADAWRALSTPASPRATHAVTTLADGTPLLVAGGSTWTRRESLFQVVGTAPFDGDRIHYALAFDEVNRRVVAMGGDTNDVLSNETWTWDGTSWSLVVGPGPLARSHHAMATNPGGGVVLFGGVGESDNLGDTWILDGASPSWRRATTTPAPSARGGAAMTFDPVARRAILFGGRALYGANSRPTQQDTWSWDGSTWVELTPAGRASHRYGHTMAFERNAGVVVLYGGLSPFDKALNDAWIFDGATWLSITTRTNPPAGANASLGYDDRAKELVLVGAGATGTPAVSPWSLARTGSACARPADCPGSFCVDGVCCDVARCSTCETCAGLRPGKCTPVTNGEDADTCALADGKSCSAASECKAKNGTPATAADACASGTTADGVCCNRACNGSCEACVAASKVAGSADGTCDRATEAARPEGNCSPASCDGDHKLVRPDGTLVEDCGAYKCEGAVCKKACARVTDCVGGADCLPDGRCQAFQPPPEVAGCSSAKLTKLTDVGGYYASLLGILLALGTRSAARRSAPRK